jgi:hypothetical protein
MEIFNSVYIKILRPKSKISFLIFLTVLNLVLFVSNELITFNDGLWVLALIILMIILSWNYAVWFEESLG